MLSLKKNPTQRRKKNKEDEIESLLLKGDIIQKREHLKKIIMYYLNSKGISCTKDDYYSIALNYLNNNTEIDSKMKDTLLAILYIIKLVNTFAHINSNKEYDIKTTKEQFHIFLQNFKDENTVLNASLLNRYLEQLEKSGEGNIIINMDYDEITQLSKKLNK